jgi:hypothetical protein
VKHTHRRALFIFKLVRSHTPDKRRQEERRYTNTGYNKKVKCTHYDCLVLTAQNYHQLSTAYMTILKQKHDYRHHLYY